MRHLLIVVIIAAMCVGLYEDKVRGDEQPPNSATESRSENWESAKEVQLQPNGSAPSLARWRKIVTWLLPSITDREARSDVLSHHLSVDQSSARFAGDGQKKPGADSSIEQPACYSTKSPLRESVGINGEHIYYGERSLCVVSA